MMFSVLFFQFLVSIQALDIDNSDSDSWRCGIFIPGAKWRTPLAKFFVLQSIHKADCPAKFRDSKINGRFAKICGKLGMQWEEKFLNFDTFWAPASRSKVPNNKRPVDACTIVQEELGLLDVPTVNERKYPDGVPLGFYYNYCGGSLWRDTGIRSQGKICCQNGKSRNCEQMLKEIAGKEDEESEFTPAASTTTSTTTTTTTTTSTTTITTTSTTTTTTTTTSTTTTITTTATSTIISDYLDYDSSFDGNNYANDYSDEKNDGINFPTDNYDSDLNENNYPNDDSNFLTNNESDYEYANYGTNGDKSNQLNSANDYLNYDENLSNGSEYFTEYDDQNLNGGQNNNYEVSDNQIVEEENSSGKINNLLSALLNDEDLSEQQIYDLKDTLNKLKEKSGKISKKIEALEQILDAEGKLNEETEKKDATTLLNVANCVNIKIDIEF